MIRHLDVWSVTAVMVLFGAAELVWGGRRPARALGEWLVEALSLGQFALFIKPLILVSTVFTLRALVPSWANALESLPVWQGVLLALVPADLLHYGYHRLGHTLPVMWGMHRTHHSSSRMSVTMSFRENWRWFVFMPDLWYASALVYFGLGEAVLISTTLFGCANVLVHSGVAWDSWLYRARLLRPLVWVLERVVQLPSAHRAHHAVFDGQGLPPHHNFAQLFMLWDTLFGTAEFPRGADPVSGYGVSDGPAGPWYAQLWSARSLVRRA